MMDVPLMVVSVVVGSYVGILGFEYGYETGRRYVIRARLGLVDKHWVREMVKHQIASVGVMLSCL